MHIHNETQLTKIAKAEGYGDVLELLEAASFDSVVPGLCTSCDFVASDCEPDATNNICEFCGHSTVKSCLIIAGLI